MTRTLFAALLCLTLFAVAHPLSAQAESSRSTIKRHAIVSERDYRETRENNDDFSILGIQGSLGLANQTISGAQIDSSNRIGMMWGAYFEQRLIPYFGFRLEANYNQRGFSAKDAQLGGTANFNINYMEFALLAKTQFKAGIVTPFIAVGPFLGAVVAKEETLSPLNGPSRQISNLDNAVNSVNFGMNFGGGLDFEVVRHFNLELGVRYSLGLTNVLTTAAQQEMGSTNVSLHLNDLQFIGGMAITL